MSVVMATTMVVGGGLPVCAEDGTDNQNPGKSEPIMIVPSNPDLPQNKTEEGASVDYAQHTTEEAVNAINEAVAANVGSTEESQAVAAVDEKLNDAKNAIDSEGKQDDIVSDLNDLEQANQEAEAAEKTYSDEVTPVQKVTQKDENGNEVETEVTVEDLLYNQSKEALSESETAVKTANSDSNDATNDANTIADMAGTVYSSQQEAQNAQNQAKKIAEDAQKKANDANLQVTAAENAATKAKENYDNLNTEVEKAKVAYDEAASKAKAAQEAYDKIIKDYGLGEEFHLLVDENGKLKNIEGLDGAANKAYVSAKDAVTKANNILANAESKLKSLEGERDIASSNVEAAMDALTKAENEANENKEAFENSKKALDKANMIVEINNKEAALVKASSVEGEDVSKLEQDLAMSLIKFTLYEAGEDLSQYSFNAGNGSVEVTHTSPDGQVKVSKYTYEKDSESHQLSDNSGAGYSNWLNIKQVTDVVTGYGKKEEIYYTTEKEGGVEVDVTGKELKQDEEVAGKYYYTENEPIEKKYDVKTEYTEGFFYNGEFLPQVRYTPYNDSYYVMYQGKECWVQHISGEQYYLEADNMHEPVRKGSDEKKYYVDENNEKNYIEKDQITSVDVFWWTNPRTRRNEVLPEEYVQKITIQYDFNWNVSKYYINDPFLCNVPVFTRPTDKYIAKIDNYVTKEVYLQTRETEEDDINKPIYEIKDYYSEWSYYQKNSGKTADSEKAEYDRLYSIVNYDSDALRNAGVDAEQLLEKANQAVENANKTKTELEIKKQKAQNAHEHVVSLIIALKNLKRNGGVSREVLTRIEKELEQAKSNYEEALLNVSIAQSAASDAKIEAEKAVALANVTFKYVFNTSESGDNAGTGSTSSESQPVISVVPTVPNNAAVSVASETNPATGGAAVLGDTRNASRKEASSKTATDAAVDSKAENVKDSKKDTTNTESEKIEPETKQTENTTNIADNETPLVATTKDTGNLPLVVTIIIASVAALGALEEIIRRVLLRK